MGPGAHLKRTFHLFFLHPSPDCPCEHLAMLMDYWGPSGCRIIEPIGAFEDCPARPFPPYGASRLEWLIEQIDAEAERRRLVIPFRKTFIRRFVVNAIRAARHDEERELVS